MLKKNSRSRPPSFTPSPNVGGHHAGYPSVSGRDGRGGRHHREFVLQHHGMQDTGRAPAGGDTDSLAFQLAALTDGHAYTQQDFEAYFATASSISDTQGSEPSADPSLAIAGASPVSNATELETLDASGPGGGEIRVGATTSESSLYLGPSATSTVPIIARRDQPRWNRSSTVDASYSRLYDEGDGDGAVVSSQLADVTFVVDGVRVKLHKIILASRCNFFRVMFSSRWASDSASGEQVVTFDDVSLVTMWHVMHYIYTDMLPADFDVGEHALDLLEQVCTLSWGAVVGCECIHVRAV